MRAVIETVFDIFYLVTVLTVGIRMIRGSKAGTQFRLFGLMAVVLGAGIARGNQLRLYHTLIAQSERFMPAGPVQTLSKLCSAL